MGVLAFVFRFDPNPFLPTPRLFVLLYQRRYNGRPFFQNKRGLRLVGFDNHIGVTDATPTESKEFAVEKHQLHDGKPGRIKWRDFSFGTRLPSVLQHRAGDHGTSPRTGRYGRNILKLSNHRVCRAMAFLGDLTMARPFRY